MKANHKLILVIAIAVGCNMVEETPNEVFPGELTFYASNGEAKATKTYISGDGSVHWSGYDAIDVFYETARGQFKTTQSPGDEAEFSGTLGPFEYVEGAEYWAVYPSDLENNVFDGNSVILSLADEQTARAGSFASDLFISLAHSKDNFLQFYNLCGGVKFTVTTPGVNSVTFRGKNNEPIAGKVRVSFDENDRPFVSEVIEHKSEITLKGNFKVGEWYYIVCLPTLLSGGYEMVMTLDNHKTAERSGDKPVTIKRSVWGTLESLDAAVRYAVPSNAIWYVSNNIKPSVYALPEGFGASVISNELGTNGVYVYKFDGQVTTIPRKAFYETIENSAYNITNFVFPESIKEIQSEAFVRLPELTELSIPYGVTTVADMAVYCCPKLNKLIVPETVSSIGYVGLNCPINVISVDENNPYFDSRDNCNAIIETATDELVVGCAGSTFPSSIKAIGNHAFDQCHWIGTVAIPEGVTEIRTSAFADCTGLSDLALPSTLKYIGNRAFAICPALQTITIPESVTEIGNAAFSGCTGLEKIEVLATNPPAIGDYVFNATNDCPIYVPVESVTKYKTAENWSEYSNRIYGNVVEPEAVDLGLSVKWASFNLGASAPEEYGDYYAWGEIAPYYSSINPVIWKEGKKAGYSWASYQWCNGSETSLTKYYCNSYWASYDNPDNMMDLGDYDYIDDAARQKLGGCWRLPTNAEWAELKENCTVTWTYTPAIGRVVTSNIPGYTDKSIFLPAAGHWRNTAVEERGYRGVYWCNSVHPNAPSGARYIDFWNGGFNIQYTTSRCDGISVRPVYDDQIHVESVSLNKTSISHFVGDSEQLEVSIAPTDATNKNLVWSSSDTSVATVDSDGLISAVAEGTATIIVQTVDRGLTASCDVTVQPVVDIAEFVDLGLSVKWASCNLGASKPEEYGDYYAWGEIATKDTYSRSNYKFGTRGDSLLSKYNSIDGKIVLDLEDDVAHVILGGSRRMPTNAEWAELIKKCTWTEVENYNNTGINGLLVSATNGNNIFIPIAGHYENSIVNAGFGGLYWSSSLYDGNPDYAWDVAIGKSGSSQTGLNNRYVGQSVRPVCDH